MGKIIAVVILMIVIYICAIVVEKNQMKSISDHVYVPVDTSILKYKHQVYVPINYHPATNSKTKIGKVILKIRNTSFSDSIYLSRIEYYDTQGILLKSFIDSILLVNPMATTEIIVKSKEFKKTGR